jgi:DnaK suppressor protein
MNKKDVNLIEKKLLAERERLARELEYLDGTFMRNLKESSGDLSSYAFHMADQGSDEWEREMNTLRSSTEGRMLLETVEALRRLYRGEYGICTGCGKKIARERLLAIPQARLCLDCKAREERAGR